jgi:hypothetical protein
MTPGDDPEDPEVIELAVRLALDNPMPRELDEQIANWIEPETLNCGLKHRDVMTCIHIAYPLIKAFFERQLQ